MGTKATEIARLRAFSSDAAAIAALDAHARAGFPFAGLPLAGFDLMMADPAWRFHSWSPKGQAKSPDAKYRTMSLDAIARLPVQLLAARHCVLMLWVPYMHLLDGDDPSFSIPGGVMKAWGFRYVSGGPWMKTTASGKATFGTGYRVRGAAEGFLLGIRGNPKNSRSERNLIEAVEELRDLRRRHSEKPEAAYAWCERYLPGARKLDLFSRMRGRPGWTEWGDGQFKG